MQTEFLNVSGIRKSFKISSSLLGKHEKVEVLKGVSFTLQAGQTVGLVGESGSGKTTLARCVLGMLTPDAGTVLYRGSDLHKLDQLQRTTVRRDMSFVYQNPYRSLNPRFSLFQLIAEPLQAQKKSGGNSLSHEDISERVQQLLQQVGLGSMGAMSTRRRISTLSGGQAQRIAIARALALQPKLIILDEPTSALDVSVQAQILNLLVSLQQQQGYSYLFITHDLDVLRYLCDQVMVMQNGLIVEQGNTETVMQTPQHEYTRMLLAATPSLHRYMRAEPQ